MLDFKIEPMNLETDKPQIEKWDTEFQSNKNYEQIYKFVLENGLIGGLGEVIETNFEHFPIGKNERKYAFSAKAKNGTILGFLIMSAYDLQTSKPELFLQYVVVNPKYHHQGYGTEILKELFSNFKNYVSVKPKFIFSYIEKGNQNSQLLFKHFGFELGDVPREDYVCASIDGKTLRQTIEAQNQRI